MIGYTSAFSPELHSMEEFRKAAGLSSYKYQLRSFDGFCSEYHSQSRVLTRTIVLGWLEKELEHRNDIRQNTTAIRQFGRYLISCGQEAYVLPNNFRPHRSSFVPHIFSDTELNAFFRAADTLQTIGTKNPYDGVIAPVLFRLIYTCGLRPNEGREIKREHINFQTGEILISHNKQKKERIVVISDDMLELCRRYDVQRSIFAAKNDFFFPYDEASPYSAAQMSLLFTRCWENANHGLNRSTFPRARSYDLRHRFASTVIHRWLDEGRDLYVMLPYLRSYMGHKEFSGTAYYIHLLPESLVKSSGIDWSEFESLIPEVAE